MRYHLDYKVEIATIIFVEVEPYVCSHISDERHILVADVSPDIRMHIMLFDGRIRIDWIKQSGAAKMV